MNIRNSCFLVLLTIVTGCEDVIELDLPHNNPRIIVDALLTDGDDPAYVRISHTQKYSYRYVQDTQTFESGAVVIIHEDSGITDTLTEVSTGTYMGHPEIIRGSIGKSYWLEINTAGGKHYISDQETMLDVAKIDTIYYSREYTDKSPDNPDYYRFNVYIDWQDPESERNYYLRTFSYYWSGVWHDNIHWNWVFSDKYFNGKFLYKDNITSDYGGRGFKIKVTQYSLTKPAYDFWILVHKQTIDSENLSINSSLPIIGNIYNVNNTNDYALGYFQVSARKSAEIWIN
ncbi:MAG: DUF4249 domain-containing protein [Bacteroidales bacterium]|nr:DUF4249 domain-containing protein [Bacteroidales bacterium]